MHGQVVDGWLIKKGKQVHKFWKHDGYAVPSHVLEKVKGVVLHTKYDGILYATSATIMEHGKPNNFEGEHQLVMPVEYWRLKDDTARKENADN